MSDALHVFFIVLGVSMIAVGLHVVRTSWETIERYHWENKR